MRKPVVLIGPVSNDPAESVSAVNRALIAGLNERYSFIASSANRRFGGKAQSRLNVWNLFYLTKHSACWIWNLIRHRPQIAHYSINSGWALKKSLFFLRIARAFDARTVGHLHSGGFLDFWAKLPAAQRQTALQKMQSLDALIVLSDGWRKDVATKVGVMPDRLHVVNNPLNPAFETAALAYPVERPTCTFVSMGVMGRDKGVLDLVAAAAEVRSQHPDFMLQIAGPEREAGIRQRVLQLMEEHNLRKNINLLGSIWGADKSKLFEETAVSILPSYYENFPLVVLEAAAAGHAIITTPVGAVPEFFAHGKSALFVEPGNVGQIADAMKWLLNNPIERVRLAREARRVFRDTLSRDAIMKSLDRIYSGVVGAEAQESKLVATGVPS